MCTEAIEVERCGLGSTVRREHGQESILNREDNENAICFYKGA